MLTEINVKSAIRWHFFLINSWCSWLFIPCTMAIPIFNTLVHSLINGFAAFSRWSAMLFSFWCLKSASFIFQSNHLMRIFFGIKWYYVLKYLIKVGYLFFYFIFKLLYQSSIFLQRWLLKEIFIVFSLCFAFTTFLLLVFETIFPIYRFYKFRMVLTIIP